MMKFTKIITLMILLAFTYSCKANTPQTDKEKTVKKKTIKVALLLDTSNSMDGLINQAKAQLWQIVNELSYAKCGNEKPNLKIALYEYGNDNLSNDNGYIRRVLRFSEDLDDISERLFSLSTSGGSEYCGTVIQTSLNELEWGKDKSDLKMIFIAGNEPFTQGKISYRDAVTNAKEKDIVVNTIFCGDYDQGISGMWQDGAYRGNGDYMTINQNKKIVHVTTPYDQQIIILNKKLNNTYIYYGKNGRNKMLKQQEQDDNAYELAEEVVVKRAVTKSSSLYKNSSWDLVDQSKEKKINYKTLEKNKLPEELQGKSEAEIKTYVDKKAEERKQIQRDIKELDKKRRKFMNEKQTKDHKKNELETVIINAIKKQAKLKNYTW